jgi:cysteine synthase A
MDQLIGSTPLLRLGDNLFAKAEFVNLTGSVKDRAAKYILEDAEEKGLLSPGGTIIEPTSGNMGIALAALAAPRGYRCIIVMPDSMSAERIALMRSYGAEVVLTPGQDGMAGSIAKAQELADSISGSFVPGQFENPANALAHYRTTGPEIWAQTEGKADIFVTGVGTGGTITGTGRYLKEQNADVKIIAIEPAASPLLSAGRAGSHGIQGIGANFIPTVLDRTLLDDVITVSDQDAFSAARELARKFGILSGISAGANYHAAAILAAENPGKTVVTLLPDSGTRYLSTGIFG